MARFTFAYVFRELLRCIDIDAICDRELALRPKLCMEVILPIYTIAEDGQLRMFHETMSFLRNTSMLISDLQI